MTKNKIAILTFLLSILISIMFTPAANAQKENVYGITADEAFEHANAQMISFIAAGAPKFENWAGASIDPKPLELYDINGQKLFYQFSVYKDSDLIGSIDIYANKMLGYSFNDIAFDPEPYKAVEAMKKSIETAKKNYPTGEITSTEMVVYSYPSIGAMTAVKDKTTGVESRIFIDAYTLDEIQDKPATETELGVWSMYDQILKKGKDKNLKEWEKSDQFKKSIKQTTANKGVNFNVAVTEENIKKLSNAAMITASTSKKLGVPCRGQESDIYCGEASIQMVSLYYGYPTPKQERIYDYFFDSEDEPAGLNPAEIIQWAGDKWNKTGYLTTNCTSSGAVNEINSYRPFYSMTSSHYRVCQGYLIQNGYTSMYINDPMPVGSNGTPKVERIGNGTEKKRIYVR